MNARGDYLYLAGGGGLIVFLSMDLERGQEALRASDSSVPDVEASVPLPLSRGSSCSKIRSHEGDSGSSCIKVILMLQDVRNLFKAHITYPTGIQ